MKVEQRFEPGVGKYHTFKGYLDAAGVKRLLRKMLYAVVNSLRFLSNEGKTQLVQVETSHFE